MLSLLAKDTVRVLGFLLKDNTPTVMVYDHNSNDVDAQDKSNPDFQGTMSLPRIRFSPGSVYVERINPTMPAVHRERAGHLVKAVGVYVSNSATAEQRALWPLKARSDLVETLKKSVGQ